MVTVISLVFNVIEKVMLNVAKNLLNLRLYQISQSSLRSSFRNDVLIFFLQSTQACCMSF